MPTFSGVNHISITVRDMDKSLEFYRDMVGLKVLADISVDERPDHPKVQYRGNHAKRRFATLDTGGGPVLALISHPGDDLAGDAILLDDVGITHFAFTVTDLKQFIEEMVKKGAEPAGPGFFFDPDGILVQFEEPGEAEAIMAKYKKRIKSEAGS
jgi:glyoxylase I family protein